MEPTLKVRATVNTIGLKPGQEAEVSDCDIVRSLLRSGLLLLLRPKE